MEEQSVHGSDEEIDDPPDVDSDEDLTDEEHKENQDEVSPLDVWEIYCGHFFLFTMFLTPKWMEIKGQERVKASLAKKDRKLRTSKINDYNRYYIPFLK